MVVNQGQSVTRRGKFNRSGTKTSGRSGSRSPKKDAIKVGQVYKITSGPKKQHGRRVRITERPGFRGSYFHVEAVDEGVPIGKACSAHLCLLERFDATSNESGTAP